MAEPKTKKNNTSVTAFIASIEDDAKRKDAKILLKLMKEVTGKTPKMWGDTIVGFDTYHYVYESGREGDWFRVGFSPRKSNLTLYIMPGFQAYDELLGRLGKHKTGKSCLYVKRLDDVDLDVLRELVEQSVAAMAKKYD